MPEKPIYEYAFIRFVPKVERGEFINVGVILFCKQLKFLQMKYHLDDVRLTAFSPGTDRHELSEYLQAWEVICEGGTEGQPLAGMDQASRFRWLTATRSTIIQCSEVHPGRCHNPGQQLQDLFSRYVL